MPLVFVLDLPLPVVGAVYRGVALTKKRHVSGHRLQERHCETHATITSKRLVQIWKSHIRERGSIAESNFVHKAPPLASSRSEGECLSPLHHPQYRPPSRPCQGAM